MKDLIKALIFGIAVTAFAAIFVDAFADELPKMQHVDELELENIALKIGNLQRSFSELTAERAIVLKKYHLHLGDDGVVKKDGLLAPAKKEAKK